MRSPERTGNVAQSPERTGNVAQSRHAARPSVSWRWRTGSTAQAGGAPGGPTPLPGCSATCDPDPRRSDGLHGRVVRRHWPCPCPCLRELDGPPPSGFLAFPSLSSESGESLRHVRCYRWRGSTEIDENGDCSNDFASSFPQTKRINFTSFSVVSLPLVVKIKKHRPSIQASKKTPTV